MSVNFVMKAMLSPYDVSGEDVGLGDVAIDDLFKADYDLPCHLQCCESSAPFLSSCSNIALVNACFV